MKPSTLSYLSRRVLLFGGLILVCCLSVGVVWASVAPQEDSAPVIESFWSADATGAARPSAAEVSAAVARLRDAPPRQDPGSPRAAYADPTADILHKWLHVADEDYGLSVAGGVLTTDMPTQALGLPATFNWQAITFDLDSFNLSPFDYVPNSGTSYFNGTAAAVTDGTFSGIPAEADLTRVSITANGATTRWQLTSRGAHPGPPDAYRLGYNNNIKSGGADLVQFIGATPFTPAGWLWRLRDRGSFFPWWSDALDITEVSVDSVGDQDIRFAARVDGTLATSYSSTAAWPRFAWYIDADNNATTGDSFTFSYQEGSYVFRYDLVGVEAVAQAFYDPTAGQWVGMLRRKVSATEWQTLDVAAPVVMGDGVAMVFSRGTAGLRSTFKWGLVSSFDVERGGLAYYGRADVAPNSGMKAETISVDPNLLLAEQYAPIVRLADEHDLYPVDIAYTLAESDLWNGSGGVISRLPTVADLVNNQAAGNYLDLVGEDAAESMDHWHNSGSRPATVYARVVNSGDRTAIQYWFHYYYSGWAYTKGCNAPGVCVIVHLPSGETQAGNNHEGDWEMIQVMIQNGAPRYAVYAQHHHATKRLWEHVEKGGPEGNNPVVYVGNGSHASYFKDSYYYDQLIKVDDFLAEETGTYDSPALAVQLLPSDVSPQWLPFQGLWGGDRGTGGSGTGPRWSGEKWTDPFNWGDGGILDAVFWDDELHYGHYGLTSRAYKVAIETDASRYIDLQLRQGFFGEVLLGKGVNKLECPQSGGANCPNRRAEYLLNCENNSRQTLLIHKLSRPSGSHIRFEPHLSPVNCVTAGRATQTAETVTLTIELSVPRADGVVTTARYENVTLSTDGVAGIALDSADLALALDQDSNGVIDETVLPTSTSSETVDVTAPATIADLTVDAGVLRWTAPADVGPTGRAAAYEVRYAGFPVTDGTWAFAEPLIHALTPGAPGTAESLPVTGLPPGDYFFAIRAVDAEYNTSAVSNGASGRVGGAGKVFAPVVLKR